MRCSGDFLKLGNDLFLIEAQPTLITETHTIPPTQIYTLGATVFYFSLSKSLLGPLAVVLGAPYELLVVLGERRCVQYLGSNLGPCTQKAYALFLESCLYFLSKSISPY